jgi:hypothetical protein
MGADEEAAKAFEDGVGTSMGDAAKAELRGAVDSAAAAAVRGGSHAAAEAAAGAAFKDTMTAAAHQSPEAFVQSVEQGVHTVSDAKTTLKNENPQTVATSEKTTIDAAGAAGRTSAAEGIAKSKFGLSTGAILSGVALTAYCVYSLVLFEATNGKTITITNVTQLDSGHVQVSYNPPNSTFMLRVNDTLDFSGCIGSDCTVPPLGNGERVDQLIDNQNFVIAKSVTYPQAYTSTPAGSPIPAASPGSTWGTAVVHSSFSNQVIGAVADTTSAALGAAGAAADVALNTAADVANTAINAAAPVASNLINTGANLAGGAFCDIVPFLCNSTIWWILAIVCLVIILGGGAFMVLSKKKG